VCAQGLVNLTTPTGRGLTKNHLDRGLAALTALASSCVFAFAASAAPQHVLLLSDTSSERAEALIGSHIREALRQNVEEVEVFAESLDIIRFPEAEQQSVVADFLRERYAGRRIDAALVIGPASLNFLADRRAELFPDTPIVYGGVRATAVPANLSNATGAVSNFDLEETVDLALGLQPDARRLVVISGVAALDRSWNAVAEAVLEPYRRRIDITHLAGLPKAELLEQVRRLPRETIVLFLTMREDGGGEVFEDGRVIAHEIAKAASAPVYGVYETYLGQGVVGGYVEPFEATGDAMAALTVRILRGQPAADLPPVSSAKSYAADWQMLRRWNLDETSLLPGTEVLFREPSLWAQYRGEILGVASLVSLQTLLIVALLLYIRKRRVERALLQIEDRYRHVVEAQIDLICHYAPDTTLTFVNDTYCRYFGHTREELIGRRFIELIPEAEREAVLERVLSLVTGTATVSYTHQVTLADGSVRWTQWLDHAIVGTNGEVIEIQGIGRDVTELKAAEIEAQQRREQVTHLTRVAILGELSGALAHELNQPMTAILSNAQTAERLLQQEKPDLVELRAIVKDIVADDVRAGEVIRRLRALLKPGATIFQPLDIAALFGEVLVLMRTQLLEQHVIVVERFASPLPPVHGDRIQLQQVLLNLLMNACEAMRDNEPADRTLTATASHANGYVKIAVTDSGAGLAPQITARLFEPFFTTKTDGLGLGLSICRSIVSLHGGSIAARNNADRGATIEFSLPVAAAEAQRGQRPKPGAGAGRARAAG
jgi:PAS domain S-box-containing protein